MRRSLSAAILFAALAAAPASAAYDLKLGLELGFVGALSHKVQFSNDGTLFDYVKEGGQDTLAFAQRLTVETGLGRGHSLVFLYQTLQLDANVVLTRDVRVDGAVFSNGQAISTRYGFPFYRLSWLKRLTDEGDDELSIGASLQIRNATIEFETRDGKLLRSNRDVGPVPLFKMRWTHVFPCKIWLGAELDAIYAPIKYLNGGSSDVVGALVDFAFRAGFRTEKDSEVFLTLRWLGGGAEGTSKDGNDFGDGFVKNWLHFMNVTVGFSLKAF